MPLAFLPILFQYLYLMKDSYHYEGLIAMLFWSLALNVYSYSARRFNWTYRNWLLAGDRIVLHDGICSYIILP